MYILFIFTPLFDFLNDEIEVSIRDSYSAFINNYN